MKDGLPAIEGVRVLRSLYGLSVNAAKEIVEEFLAPRPGRLPAFRTWERLEDWLRRELGYCGCDYFEDAIYLLRDVLRSFATGRPPWQRRMRRA